MPPLRINKKLKPAKRAWKSFTEMLKSKFRDLEIAKSIRDSTSRVLEFLSRRLVLPFKTRYLKNTSSRTHRYRYKYNDNSYRYMQIQQYQRQPGRDCSDSCVADRFYKGGEGVRKRKEKVEGRKEEKGEEEGEGEETVDSMEEAWRRVVAASPHLRVDERAEEFICRFREEIRIDKERSFLEFQERLKRSA
ncbi:PREDICTED: uncharacterized protein LOC104808623 [Tarenaya hassleriana]|uniref:uncharacterized protein LOC104808623 n=1 Tax=Tarenaya hassleriana TaxID=28532 RepID=UPI00053C4E16|nr:PREDICTED: uncharacterized protein LOC104808623 [Tarenaya hassleriana]